MKKLLSLIMLGILFIGIGVFADDILEATGIKYKNKSVEDSLNELYIKANAKDVGAQQICKLTDTTYGSFGEIGSMYECEVGNNIKYSFYLLTDRGTEVDLIMNKNITQETNKTTMTWYDAMDYIVDNNLKNSWNNVLNVDLPKAQAIADAAGNSSWKASSTGSAWCFGTKKKDSSSVPYCTASTLTNYNWLYDYTRECNGCLHSLGSTEAYGYWTRDLVPTTDKARSVLRYGTLDTNVVSSNDGRGVRPVITVLKTNLYTE